MTYNEWEKSFSRSTPFYYLCPLPISMLPVVTKTLTNLLQLCHSCSFQEAHIHKEVICSIPVKSIQFFFLAYDSW